MEDDQTTGRSLVLYIFDVHLHADLLPQWPHVQVFKRSAEPPELQRHNVHSIPHVDMDAKPVKVTRAVSLGLCAWFLVSTWPTMNRKRAAS